ncbi:hypothetical protein [Allosphingosinicella humi]|jgi:hypothetical protein
MRDDFATSAWADHSPHFYADIAQVLDKVHFAFERLAAIEFAAPWHEADGAASTRRAA